MAGAASREAFPLYPAHRVITEPTGPTLTRAEEGGVQLSHAHEVLGEVQRCVTRCTNPPSDPNPLTLTLTPTLTPTLTLTLTLTLTPTLTRLR